MRRHPADHLTQYEALEAAPGLPAVVAAHLGDWVARHREALELWATFRDAGDRARAELEAAKATAPERLVAALAAGKVRAELVGSELPALRAALDAAEARYAIAAKAVDLTYRGMVTTLTDNAPEMLRWVAAARAGVPWSDPLPGSVAFAWSVIGPRFRFTLPADACIRANNADALYPSELRPVILEPSERPAYLSHPMDRHPFAWAAIAAGDHRCAADPRQNGMWHVRIMAVWDDREPLAATAGNLEGRKATRGTLAASRGR